jgi:ribonuclease VapC
VGSIDLFVDTSAVVAVVFYEPERDEIKKLLASTSRFFTSPIVRLETSLVVAQRLNITPTQAEMLFDEIVNEASIQLVPISDEIGSLAVSAYEKFGKGRHPAKLNLADCFSYAVAKHLKMPILFVGNDFSKTDLKSAL